MFEPFNRRLKDDELWTSLLRVRRFTNDKTVPTSYFKNSSLLVCETFGVQLKAAIIADKPEDVASCLRRIPYNVDALTIEHVRLPGLSSSVFLILQRFTLIEMAILKKDTEILRILLDKEAEFQQKCLLDSDPLVAACSNGYLEGVELLIERGSDVCACCLSGYTCLLAAAKNEHLAVVSYLLEQDSCNVNEVGRDGYSAIHHIALLNDSDAVFKLISRGADVNAQTWVRILLFSCLDLVLTRMVKPLFILRQSTAVWSP